MARDTKRAQKKGSRTAKVGQSSRATKQPGGKSPGRGSKKGERRGGRQPGTPNKRTLELREALEAAGLNEETHPVVMMFKVYTGEITMPTLVTEWVGEGKDRHQESHVEDLPLEPGLRVACMREVAQYLEPKRKAVEVSNALDEDGNARPFLVDSAMAPEWLISEPGRKWLKTPAGQEFLAARGLSMGGGA